MKYLLCCAAATVVILILSPVSAQSPPASGPAAALFHEGLMLERAEGKLQEAIFRFERVVAEFPKDQQIAPQALYHLALAYERTRDPRAIVLLNRLVAEYPDARPFAADARAKLAALQGAARDAVKRRDIDDTFEYGSPDGRLVVYHRDGVLTRLYLRDLRSRAERVLLDLDGYVSNYAWAPDSRRLVFNYQRDTGTPRVNDIRVVTIATGEVASLNVRGYPMSWTTADTIFFYRPNYAENTVDWWVVPVSGGEPRKVVAAPNSDGGFALISPDGGSVLVGKNGRVALRDLATGAERAVTTGSADETRFLFSPDGLLVAFLSNPEGQWGLYAAPVDRIPVRAPVRLAAVDPAAVAPGTAPARPWWTADGLLTLPVRRVEGHIFRVAMDSRTGRATDAPVRLTQDTPQNSWPVVSPDGKYIAYTYRSLSTGGVAVMNADGTSERPLVELKGTLPIFWRGVDDLLFYDFSVEAGQKPPITSINVRTGARQALAQVEGLYWWYVPERREILSSHPGGGGARAAVPVRAHSLATGTDRLVATIDYLMPRMTVAPDGRRFAYAVLPDAQINATRCEVSIMTLDGVREKVLVPMREPCGIPVSWSPDGRFLLLGMTTQGPRVANVETGETWPLHADMTGAEWGPGSWSPDGSFVVLTRSSARTERLAWEGVTYDAVIKLMNSRR